MYLNIANRNDGLKSINCRVQHSTSLCMACVMLITVAIVTDHSDCLPPPPPPPSTGGQCAHHPAGRGDHGTAEHQDALPLQHPEVHTGGPRGLRGGEEAGRSPWSPGHQRRVVEAAGHSEAFQHKVEAGWKWEGH